MSYNSEVLPTGNANNHNNKRSAFSRFLATVEWLGNLLPHPITLFCPVCGGHCGTQWYCLLGRAERC